MEIEINFRFDENGRTANTKNNNDDGGALEENTAATAIDYGFKAEMTNLLEISESSMDELLFDCEISDNVIMPRTYWMPADGTTQPRCTLEQLALDIFRHHVPSDDLDYDRETSGAEWWCQLRPSPVMGRHTVVCASSSSSSGDDNEDDPFKNGISFHVDKDEELRILTGGSTYVHPHISTITYFTDLGSPTLIMDCQVHPLTGEWIVPDASVEGFVSWPSVGKHTSFDGRYLHAAPPDLMGSKDAFRKQLESAVAKNGDDNSKSKAQKRRHRRVTFLVNIWLNYRPYDVNPFPESMIDKMSGRDSKTRKYLKFPKELPSCASSSGSHVTTTYISSNRATEKGSPSDRVYTTERFTWPLGDKHSKEELRCEIPMKSITDASTKGGNVRIHWEKKQNGSTASENNGIDHDCFRLYSGKSCPAAASASTTTHTEEEDSPEGITSAKRPRVE